MTELLTAEMDRLRRRADDIRGQIAALEGQIIEQRRFLAEVGGEMRGLERAAELFGDPASPPAGPRRHSVQGPVMKLFKPGESWTAEEMIDLVNRMPREAELPAASVRDFLTRAARTGKLVNEDGRYRLPPAQGNEMVP